jgi:hypothetical protein
VAIFCCDFVAAKAQSVENALEGVKLRFTPCAFHARLLPQQTNKFTIFSDTEADILVIGWR